MAKTKKDAAATRQALLDAALEVFSRKGYSRTNLVEIVKKAGLTRGALYWHFPDKYKLFEALFQSIHYKIDGCVADVLNSDSPPLEKIRHILINVMKLVVKYPGLKAIDEIMLFKEENSEEMDRLYEFHMDFEKKKRGELLALIKEAIASGQLSPRFEPPVIATAIYSYLSGVSSAWLYDDTPFSLEEKAEVMADVLLQGIATRKSD